ncbi:MAG: hypothetical protein V3W44_10975 [Dehalococcoidales bacterium]
MPLELPKYSLPEQGDSIPPQTLELEHPDFIKSKKLWEFYRHSDELTGGYEASVDTFDGPGDVPTFKETYLIPHIKEHAPGDFERRVAAAKPPRFVKEGIESLTGVITQQAPNRENYPDKLSKWESGVTIDNTSLQQWISADMWPLVERYGLCYSYARRPSIGGANLAEQEQKIKDANLPDVLLHIVTPENLPWWDTDELGAFLIVRYTETIQRPVMDDVAGLYPIRTDEITRHWWITHEGWWYTEEGDTTKDTSTQYEVLDVGTWGKPMKHFPIVKWSLKDDIGPTATASLAQLMYFRKDSELHIVEVGAAFPMVWVPITSGDENPAEMIKGVDPVGGYSAEHGGKPIILETAGVSLTHFADKRLPQLEAEASAPYGINDTVGAGSNDSGVALAHIQEKAKNLYRQHARAGGKSEFSALQPVAELLGEELLDEHRAAWPNKFGTLSDTSQSEILTAFAALEPGDVFTEHILVAYAAMVLELTAEQIDTAIESWKEAKEEQEAREAEMEEALAEGEQESRRAGVDKMDAETANLKKPFAANPASAKGPSKGNTP